MFPLIFDCLRLPGSEADWSKAGAGYIKKWGEGGSTNFFYSVIAGNANAIEYEDEYYDDEYEDYEESEQDTFSQVCLRSNP